MRWVAFMVGFVLGGATGFLAHGLCQMASIGENCLPDIDDVEATSKMEPRDG